jgi:hypothetical protein
MQRGSNIRKNGDLRGLPRVRVIGPSGIALGIMTLAEALRLAFKEGLDLVEVNPKASPPTCAIVDFDKYKDEEKKKQADARRGLNRDGRFCIEGRRGGLVSYEDGARRGHLDWEMPSSISKFSMVIYGEKCAWTTPEPRKMSRDEVRGLARDLAAEVRVRIDLWFSDGSEDVRPPDRRA